MLPVFTSVDRRYSAPASRTGLNYAFQVKPLQELSGCEDLGSPLAVLAKVENSR
jgi:hypothetical protein